MINRSQYLGALRTVSAFVTVSALAASLFVSSNQTVQAAGTSFKFGAAGDHNVSGTQAPAVFQKAGQSNLSFFQSLGDLSYGQTSTSSWCQFVKDSINTGAGFSSGNAYGENFPFFVVAGNHESRSTATGAPIEDFTAAGCLPAPASIPVVESPYIDNQPVGTTNYGKEYYYDYPVANPIARVINVVPDQQFDLNGGQSYDYSAGTDHYNWVAQKVDEAKASGKWVIISAHEPYINAGSLHGGASDSGMDADLFNMLVAKKVDFMLFGHEHSYQRSKQLSLGAGCTSITKTNYNAACVAHAGTAGDPFVKGDGPIVIINGVGGDDEPDNVTAYHIVTSDPDYNYFDPNAMVGTNDTNRTWGFSEFTVTDTGVTVNYVEASGGPFSDSFTVAGGASTADTTAPTVSLTAPAANTTVSGDLVVTATAADDVGIAKVEFYVNTTLLGTATTSPYTYTIPAAVTSQWGAGSYTVTARAYDAADNTTTSTGVVVTVNSTPPQTPPTSFNVTNADGTSTKVSLAGTCSALDLSGPATPPSTLDKTQLVAGFGFTTSCTQAGGSATVTVDLGKQYTSSQLKVYKDKSDGTTGDVTSSVTFTDATVNGVTTTVMHYTVTDGDTGDLDGTTNSKVVDPVYVLDTSTTNSGQPQAGAGGGGSTLAATGQAYMTILLIGLGLLGMPSVYLIAKKLRATKS
ncbi:MAG: Ig-like domain-containing protein [Candidatus Saccharimonas sp.]